MPVQEYTPVVAPGGRRVHALALKDGKKTACGEPCKAFRIALKPLNCDDCKLAVGLAVRKPKRKRKPR